MLLVSAFQGYMKAEVLEVLGSALDSGLHISNVYSPYSSTHAPPPPSGALGSQPALYHRV